MITELAEAVDHSRLQAHRGHKLLATFDDYLEAKEL
jgi:hypothetical protein